MAEIEKKVVHVCLAGSYNDGWSYHDNLLSQYHKELGYDVTLITTPFVNDTDTDKYLYYKVGEYLNEYGIKIIRLPLRISQKSKAVMRLRTYRGTLSVIEKEHPDILFIHCGQFWDIRAVLKYKKNNMNVKMFIDNHADFSNSAKTWFSYHILHKMLWRSGIRKTIPYTEKYYGVLPARVDFLNKMYGIPKDKIELLVMGADDKLVKKAKSLDSIKKNMEKYNVQSRDFLLVTGGKIDEAKWQIFNLLDCVKNYTDSRLKLIMFGPIVDTMKERVLQYVDNDKIMYLPWIEAEESYGLFAIANLGVFPGRHSVYWEQAVGCGLPIMVKYWEGVEHVNLGGNCIFLTEDTAEEIRVKLQRLLAHEEEYAKMKAVAEEKGPNKFSYLNLAKRSIEIS